MKRGDVYFASLGYKTGSEQGGYRPVVIIQNDKGNTFSPTVLVACITKKNNRQNKTRRICLSSFRRIYGEDRRFIKNQFRNKRKGEKEHGTIADFQKRRVWRDPNNNN